MKLILALLVFLPSLALARSVTIDVADDLTFDKIETFADGTTIIHQPKMYGFFFRATYDGEANVNSRVICEKAGTMTYVDSFRASLNRDVRVVTFQTGDGSPSFSESYLVLETAICKR